MTKDEKQMNEVECRVRGTFVNGVGSISEQDFNFVMNSWLAWKMTAKCFAGGHKVNDEIDNVELIESMIEDREHE